MTQGQNRIVEVISRITKNPLPRGVEVKCVEFDLISGHVGQSGFEQLRDMINDWLCVEFNTSLPIHFWASSNKAQAKDINAKKYLDIRYLEGKSGEFCFFEILFLNAFSFGLETTRIRAIEFEKSTKVEISTFIYTKNAIRPLSDIPRVADSLSIMLSEDPALQVMVEGIELRPAPIPVTLDRVHKNPLNIARKQGKLPILLLLGTSSNQQLAVGLAREFFGQAIVMVLKSKEIDGVHNRRRNQETVLVEWRDSYLGRAKYDTLNSLLILRKDLRAHQMRVSVFASSWRHAIGSQFAVKGEVAGKLNANPAPEGLTEIKTELEQALFERDLARAELANFISEFDFERENWKTEKEKYRLAAIQQNSIVYSSVKHDIAATKDLILDVNLDATDLPEMFANISLATSGAIVFTPRVHKSWLEAEKRGYRANDVMEEALTRLARFAVAYQVKRGSFGIGIKEFALRDFKLELVMDDNIRKMAHPKFEFEGRTYTQEKHIRANENTESFDKLGRIHFAFDEDLYRIVVNHAGRKLSENDK